jgi:DNA polymerase-3 subunit epsilon
VRLQGAAAVHHINPLFRGMAQVSPLPEAQNGPALRLERPIAFVDLQSTGLDPRSARIVRIAVLKVAPDGDQQLRTALVNPGEPIPPGATRVHGITDDDVAGAPPFRAYARALAAHLEDCELAGYGIERFDLPLLLTEFRRAGVEFGVEGRAVVDAMVVFHRLAPRDLTAAYRQFVGGELRRPLEAETLVKAAHEVLLGQLRTALELPRDPAGLAAWQRGAGEDAADPEGRFIWSGEGEALLNFGRYRGMRVAEVAERDRGYLQWVASNAEFHTQARRIAGQALEGGAPRREDK